MTGGADIREWRRAQRSLLLERRLALPRKDRERCRTAVVRLFEQQVPEVHRESIGFYWPIKGEIDLRSLAESLHHSGSRLSLPVVVEKDKPLEFWRWRPGDKLVRGTWRIPVPSKRDLASPTLLVIPILGFDEKGFRLGYGGGYYDRTLAALHPKPYAIGVGYEFGRIASIHPQPYDIPMDAIATEAGIVRFETRRSSEDLADPNLRTKVLSPEGAIVRSAKEHKKSDRSQTADQKLDEALICTFPASDPFTFI